MNRFPLSLAMFHTLALTPGARQLVELQLDQERAEQTLAVIVGPDRFDPMFAVAVERGEQYRVNWRETPIRPPNMTALAAGLRSVIDDVQQGPAVVRVFAALRLSAIEQLGEANARDDVELADSDDPSAELSVALRRLRIALRQLALAVLGGPHERC